MNQVWKALKTTRRDGAESSVNLAKRRAWFADENAQAGSGQTGTGASSAGTQNTEHMIPKSRLDEALERARKAEEMLAQVQTTAQAAEQERLKKQGEWQQIADNALKENEVLKSFRQRTEMLEGTIKAANEALIAQVPDSMKKLIPVDYPPERLQLWLNENWRMLTVPPSPNIDAGAGVGSGAKPINLTPEQLQVAKQLGVSPEAYAKRLAEIQGRG